VPVGKGPGAQLQLNALRGAGSELDADKAAQLLLGSVDGRRPVGDVELRDLSADAVTRIGDGEGDPHPGGAVVREHLNVDVPVGETRV